MRLLNLFLLGLLLAGAAFAQTTPPTDDPPGVTVTKFRWQKDVYIPALFDDPMAPNQDQVDLRRQQKIIKRASAVRVSGGQAPLPVPTRVVNPSQPEIPGGPSVNYIYEAKVKNDGKKTIKTIIWEYLIFDPETGVQVGRHQFAEIAQIRPGKTATLTGYTTSPPTSIVQVKNDRNRSNYKYSERVVINVIQYDDGSIWQQASN